MVLYRDVGLFTTQRLFPGTAELLNDRIDINCSDDDQCNVEYVL